MRALGLDGLHTVPETPAEPTPRCPLFISAVNIRNIESIGKILYLDRAGSDDAMVGFAVSPYGLVRWVAGPGDELALSDGDLLIRGDARGCEWAIFVSTARRQLTDYGYANMWHLVVGAGGEADAICLDDARNNPRLRVTREPDVVRTGSIYRLSVEDAVTQTVPSFGEITVLPPGLRRALDLRE